MLDFPKLFVSSPSMLTKIYGENPSQRELLRLVELLEHNGTIVCPTDSLYAFGCSVHSAKGLEHLRHLKGKNDFSLIFADLAQVAEFCRVDNAAFRILKRNLPGPFTFILPALSRVPEKALGKRKAIGVRIPAHPVARAVVEALGAPLVVTLLPLEDAELEYATHPELIHERYGREVEAVVDGGMGVAELSTVVDLTGDEPEIVRQGRGELR